jgi:hypothetical protein
MVSEELMGGGEKKQPDLIPYLVRRQANQKFRHSNRRLMLYLDRYFVAGYLVALRA